MEFSALAFVLKKVFSALLLPPVLPLLLIVIGLKLRYRRIGIYLSLAGVLFILLLSFPVIDYWMRIPMERANPPFQLDAAGRLPEYTRSAGAIVILGGGRNRGALEFGGESLSVVTLARVRYGARLSRRTGLPILVTGGKPDGGKASEAELMQDALKTDFGLSARWIESDSNDTNENAGLSAPLLNKSGVHTILLVTDVIHMARSRREFEMQGLTVIPASVGYRAQTPLTYYDVLPNAGALEDSCFVLHEWLGVAWQSLLRSRK